MSEEKKTTSWGKGYDASAAQEPKQSASAPTPSVEEGTVVQAAAAEGDDNTSDANAARGRNQHVLPGILGKQLRTAYSELLNNPVPDAISELVKKLERQEAERKSTAKPRDEETNQ